MKKVNYVKPNMTNMRGRMGKEIIKTIRNTPKPDMSEVKRKAAEAERRMLEGMKTEDDEWTEEDGIRYLAEIGVPIGPCGTPLGIGWDDCSVTHG